MHFLPKDVETDDLCSSPQTPSSQLERGCVSIYFPVSPSPLLRTPALCIQAAAGDFAVVGADAGFLVVFFFFSPNLPLLRASEKQTLNSTWQKMVSKSCPRERTRIDLGNFERPLGLLAVTIASS